MKAINKILEALGEGEEKKSKVIILTEGADSENDSEKTEVTKVTIKDSTGAAKLAKGKIMKYACDQVDGLSREEISDVLGSVGDLCRIAAAAFEVDNDLGKFALKHSREVAARIVKENDEQAGD